MKRATHVRRGLLIAGLCVAILAPAGVAALHTETVEYSAGGVTMQGYLAYDDAAEGPRPGVLVVHEWWGLNDFAKQKAEQLAQLGYVAFAADMYGGGRMTTDPQQAGQWAGQVRGTPALRQRAQAALEVLVRQEQVDLERLGAIGFCFGGTTVLELAYSGADLDGVVSFHGGLTMPQEGDDIRARILVLHGAADSSVPVETVQQFWRTMEQREVNWELVVFAGAKHGFMNPRADLVGMEAVGYDAQAAERAWRDMRLFFWEVFGRQGELQFGEAPAGRRGAADARLRRDLESFLRERQGDDDLEALSRQIEAFVEANSASQEDLNALTREIEAFQERSGGTGGNEEVQRLLEDLERFQRETGSSDEDVDAMQRDLDTFIQQQQP